MVIHLKAMIFRSRKNKEAKKSGVCHHFLKFFGVGFTGSIQVDHTGK